METLLLKGWVVETLWLMGMSPYFGTPCEYKKNEDEKQKILITLAEDKGRQEKKAELIDFLHEQTTEFDDGLVRRLIEQITVHESGTFTVEFKSGTMVEV